MATEQLQNELIAVLQRVNQLETQLADRQHRVREVAEAAGIAAVQAAQGQNVPQMDEGGQPIDRRAERRMESAMKCLAGIPKFHGNESWRTFESTYLTWYRINMIDQLPQDFQKRSLLMSMRGSAVEMTRPYAENTATWVNSNDLATYVEAMRTIFLPPEESELARTEFKVRKQARNEDISSYLSAKIALWQMSYREDERSFSTLMDETIAGLANKIVKRNLRYAAVTNPEDLRRQAVRLVASERQCYREGTAESTSLEGLAATTRIADQQNGDDDDMDHDGYNAMGKFQGNCRECGKFGHMKKDCYKLNKPKDGGAKGKDERKCYRCDRTGHLKPNCHAKSKANGDKITDNPSKTGKETKKKVYGKRGSIRTQGEVTDDDDEDQVEENFLDQEGDSEERK